MAEKQHTQKKHALRRAKERYGFIINDSLYDQFCAWIRDGKSRLIKKQTHRVSVHEIKHNGNKIIAVYDKQRKSIATFLPPDLKDHEIVFKGA